MDSMHILKEFLELLAIDKPLDFIIFHQRELERWVRSVWFTCVTSFRVRQSRSW